MKEIVRVSFAFIWAILLLVGCKNPTSGDEEVIQADLYGSYRGTVTVESASYDVCLDAREETIALYAAADAGISALYSNIVYAQVDGALWSFAVYADEDTSQSGDTLCTGLFTVSDTEQTCVVTITETNVSTGTLTLGDEYPIELFEGTYWGELNYAGTHSMCVDIRADYLALVSTVMSFHYSNVVWDRDSEGIWSAAAYYSNADPASADARVKVIFSNAEHTSVAIIIAMGNAESGTLTLGDDYDYDDPPENFVEPIIK